MKFTLSQHAVEQMQARGVTTKHVFWAMKAKPLAHRKHAHKSVYHGPVQMDGRHLFVVAEDRHVVTVYWLD